MRNRLSVSSDTRGTDPVTDYAGALADPDTDFWLADGFQRMEWRRAGLDEIAAEVATRWKAFLRKWRLECRAVVDSLEGEGGPWPRWSRVSPLNGERLFAFTRLNRSQWRSARTTNTIEPLNEEFRRRIKTQTVLPCDEMVPMLFWALLASRQIVMRKVDGREILVQLFHPG